MESDQFGRPHHAAHHLHDRPVRHRRAVRPQARLRAVRIRPGNLRRAPRAGDQGGDHRGADLSGDQDILSGYGQEAAAEVVGDFVLKALQY